MMQGSEKEEKMCARCYACNFFFAIISLFCFCFSFHVSVMLNFEVELSPRVTEVLTLNPFKRNNREGRGGTEFACAPAVVIDSFFFSSVHPLFSMCEKPSTSLSKNYCF
ncbi:hypothetical protein, unlikely [Trypanosoma brucei gambiense DAL972]|uniref:Uncharacterized protein n=1 Tax=Trypanosoma brucei gambiense (strain MHOM/CI/86/DAL972) TaxID=679716 RepID=C9ZV14_TRYB9|nr:hypothetical protein, unlikely [Trypanosoma brucei gambiense DAL972]CBH13252.1 hypothetical protein, unlikely [Trypanosoma brucei gambiense DAL972]|eukprot:XP_011775529.1 hypothetical protein, unlikely [Trypanosoma brucei gambiense DAL972]